MAQVFESECPQPKRCKKEEIKLISRIDGGSIQLPKERTSLSGVLTTLFGDEDDGSEHEVVVDVKTTTLLLVEAFVLHFFCGQQAIVEVVEVGKGEDMKKHAVFSFEKVKI